MKAGIVGFKGSGKTTIFNVLTGLSAEVGGFGGDKANLGNIKVPDERIDALSKKLQPKKTTYAEITFVDLAGTTSRKSTESSFSPAQLNEMKACDALVHVVRDFDNPALTEAADVLRDVQNFEGECILSDMLTVENRLARLKKEGNKGEETQVMERIKTHLEADKPLRTLDDFEEAMWVKLAGFGLLSRKPQLVLVSVDETGIQNTYPQAKEVLADHGLELLVLPGQAEAELNDLLEEERTAFLADLGITETAKSRFIHKAYAMLDLMSFLTAGPDEVRAWTIKRGTTAQKAAGKIHSDIERGFIRAEVMDWRDIVDLGSEGKCREAGKIRMEGKEYLPKDGEVMHFKFNV